MDVNWYIDGWMYEWLCYVMHECEMMYGMFVYIYVSMNGCIHLCMYTFYSKGMDACIYPCMSVWMDGFMCMNDVCMNI